jgi:glutathione S-transferase
MLVRFAQLAPDNFVIGMVKGRLSKSLGMLEERLKGNAWLAGEEFTAADIMCVCSLTTLRLFAPFELGDYPKILAYLKKIGEREGYKKAMAKGDPDLKPLLGPEAPEPLQIG